MNTKDRSRLPPMTVGEPVLWEKASGADEVCAVEIGIGIHWLIKHLGEVEGVSIDDQAR